MGSLSPAAEHKIDEIHVEIDTIDEIPDLELLDVKFSFEAQECKTEGRVTGQITGFDGHSGEFSVHFSEKVGAFWLDKHNSRNQTGLSKKNLLMTFLERAKARGKSGPLGDNIGLRS